MIIYKITNKMNGKVYIGQTTKSLASRIYGHIHGHSRIGKEMLKYGQDNFDISVIDTAKTKEELDDLEVFWIAWYNSTQNGYNILQGGKATRDELKMIRKFGSNKKHRRKKRKNRPRLTESKEPMRKAVEARRLRLVEAKEFRAEEPKAREPKTYPNKWAKIISEQNDRANREFLKEIQQMRR